LDRPHTGKANTRTVVPSRAALGEQFEQFDMEASELDEAEAEYCPDTVPESAMVCRRGKGKGNGLQKAEGLDVGTVLQEAWRVHQLAFAEVVEHLKQLASLEPGTFDDGGLRGEKRGQQVGLMVDLKARFQERVSGESGTDTCEDVSGADLRTAAPEGQLATIATVVVPAPELEANPMHCGGPVQAVQVQSISGACCGPECASGSGSSEMPAGATSKATWALRSPTGDSDSALMSNPLAASAHGASGECGTGIWEDISGGGHADSLLLDLTAVSMGLETAAG
jgi:hypothetical protein